MDRRSEYNGIIADNIRRLRIERGWSQDLLMIKLQTIGLDYSRGRISQIELKKRPPAAVLIVALKTLFECGYEDFFAEVETEFEKLL